MNRVILMGRLTREPEVRYSQNDNSMAIARYTLAVDRRRSSADGQQEADFINCVAFGRQGEFAEKYLHKGTKMAITGRIQTGSYTNKDGQKVYTTEVVVEDQEFAESKAASENSRNSGSSYNNGGSYNGGSSYSGNSGSSYNNNSRSSDVGDGFMNIPEGVEDEGLPFN